MQRWQSLETVSDEARPNHRTKSWMESTQSHQTDGNLVGLVSLLAHGGVGEVLGGLHQHLRFITDYDCVIEPETAQAIHIQAWL
jgi:hypothetical protein